MTDAKISSVGNTTKDFNVQINSLEIVYPFVCYILYSFLLTAEIWKEVLFVSTRTRTKEKGGDSNREVVYKR